MTSTTPSVNSPDATPAHPRRLLLVTGGIGAGHHAAARAVEERARRAWPGVEVVWTDTLDGMGRRTGTAFQAIYAGCVSRLPWLYELYFRLLCDVAPFRAGTRAVIGAWSARGLARRLDEHRPDLVVAVFPEGITGLARLRRRGRLPIPAVALVVDPAPHPLWADAALDLHMVSTEAGAAALRRYAPGAAVRVTALPVGSGFTPPPPRQGADPRERPLIYVSCGSLAFGDITAGCKAILDAGADVLVTSGRSAAVRSKLERVAREHPQGGRMEVVDWVDDPAATTRACDAVVTNAGGATALEALACARPLLLFAPIPGHGRANAEILTAEGVARVCPTPADLMRAVAELVDPARRQAISRRLRDRLAGADLTMDVAALAGIAAGRHSSAAPHPGPRLRAQDALFLHAATPGVPQQVGARIVLATAGTPDADADWPARMAELIRTRAGGLELLRRRVSRPRPGRPLRWLLDPAPDPARHLRPHVLGIGPGGDHASWDDAVTAFFAVPVDPFETGWEMQVARDLATGEVALLAKLHHAVGDGLAVTDTLLRLFADEHAPGPAARGPDRTPTARASDAPGRVRRAATVVRGIARLAIAGGAGRSPLTGPMAGPAHRRTGVLLDGAAVRAAARAHGVGTTVLLLAVVAETLHSMLAERGPGQGGAPASVRAMVPLTTRTSASVDSRTPGNRTAAVSLDLPTGPMPPAERVARVATALAEGSAAGQPEGAAAVLTVLGLLPGRLQAFLVRRIYGRRFFHLLASVMPGARRRAHVYGAAISVVYPVLPLADGVGLAVGALHWGRATAIGITADARLIPGIGGIPNRVAASLALVSHAGIGRPRPAR